MFVDIHLCRTVHFPVHLNLAVFPASLMIIILNKSTQTTNTTIRIMSLSCNASDTSVTVNQNTTGSNVQQLMKMHAK